MITTRPHPDAADDTFDDAEVLYRRISEEDVIRGDYLAVEAASLKFPNCSFNRSRYSKPEDARVPFQPAHNGVAALPMAKIPPRFPPVNNGSAHETHVAHAPLMCDDPPVSMYAHTELRICREGRRETGYWPSSSVAKKVIRETIAASMRIHIPPTPHNDEGLPQG